MAQSIKKAQSMAALSELVPGHEQRKDVALYRLNKDLDLLKQIVRQQEGSSKSTYTKLT